MDTEQYGHLPMYKPARDPRFQEFQGDHGRKSFLGFHAMIATVDAVFPGGGHGDTGAHNKEALKLFFSTNLINSEWHAVISSIYNDEPVNMSKVIMIFCEYSTWTRCWRARRSPRHVKS